MASVTKRNNEDAARADREPDDLPDGDDAGADVAEPVAAKPAKGANKAKSEPKPIDYASRPAAAGRGFFTIYKSGQGYWTRMGTLIGTGILGLMLAYTLYDKIPPFFLDNPAFGRKVGLGVAVAFLVIYTATAVYLMNKAANVDFLIATDSEMKKVNWTSRKELIGSTKVVVIFMLLIAAFLFLADQIFHLLFYAVGVLKTKPFFLP
jgi:preprotein translocase SecE subunit